METTAPATWDVYRAAEYIGCAPSTLRNWTSQRRVPYRKVGRLTRFVKEDLDRWLDTHCVPAAQ